MAATDSILNSSPAEPSRARNSNRFFTDGAIGGLVEHLAIYTVGATATCKTSNQKSFSCVPVQRTLDSNAPITLPDAVAFRWCSEKLRTASTPVTADCTALAPLNQPASATNARFIGQIDFMAHPERPVGQQVETVSFVYEAANLGAAIQRLKME